MTKRLFVGISLPEDFLEECVQGKNLYHFLPKIRWIPKENLHITGEFLGNVEVSRLTDLENNLHLAVGKTSPFELRFEKISFGPIHHDEGMLWAQFHMNDPWKAFIQKIRNATMSLRNQHFYKTPIPHITLARWKAAGMREKMNLSAFQIKMLEIPVLAINLYESKLLPTGSVYTIIKTFSLSP